MAHRFDERDWDTYALHYDALNGLRPYVRMLEDVVRVIPRIDGLILDAGCGTGNLIQRLPDDRRGSVVGIDSSRAMLERASTKSADATFVQVDMNGRLPFSSGTFALIVCVNALYALPNREGTLREFHRLLRRNGSLILVTPKFGYENGLILKDHCGDTGPDSLWLDAHRDGSREEFLIRKAVPDPVSMARLLTLARINRVIARERSFRFFVPDELTALVQTCGFRRIRTRTTYANQNLLLTAQRS